MYWNKNVWAYMHHTINRIHLCVPLLRALYLTPFPPTFQHLWNTNNTTDRWIFNHAVTTCPKNLANIYCRTLRLQTHLQGSFSPGKTDWVDWLWVSESLSCMLVSSPVMMFRTCFEAQLWNFCCKNLQKSTASVSAPQSASVGSNPQKVVDSR